MTEIINCENIIMSKNSLALFLLICNYRFGFYNIIPIYGIVILYDLCKNNESNSQLNISIDKVFIILFYLNK